MHKFENKKRKTNTESRQRHSLPVEQGKKFTYRTNRMPADYEVRSTRLRPEFSTADRPFKKQKFSWFSLKNLPTLLAILAIVGCLAYNSVLSDQPRVVVIGDESASSFIQDTKLYKSEIVKINNSSVLNKIKLTYNASSVRAKILDRFPELSDVDVSLPIIGKKPIIKISISKPVMILETKLGNYSIDNVGRIVSTNTDWASADVIRIQDMSAIEGVVGSRVIPSANIQFINELKHQLDAKGIVVTGISLPVASQSLIVKILDKPYYVKFTFHGDVLQQSGAFIAAYEHFNKTNIYPNEYVDVRVGEKVFIK